jgi:AhpD family alkylhydroperoxidase
MTFRVDLHRTSPKAMEELVSFQQFAGESGLNEGLVELVRMYVSRLNQCPQAREVHVRRARTLGETSERISAMSTWRGMALFSPRERAAFEWADCVLRANPRVFDSGYSSTHEPFNDAELVDLTVIIVATAAWTG